MVSIKDSIKIPLKSIYSSSSSLSGVSIYIVHFPLYNILCFPPINKEPSSSSPSTSLSLYFIFTLSPQMYAVGQ